MKLRVATTDAAAPNFVTENTFQETDGDDWLSLHMPCNDHKTSTGQSKTFSLVDSHISACIHLSLSASSAAAMIKFRRAFIQVARTRMAVLRGRYAAKDREYREFVLQLFIARGRFSHERAHMAAQALNGDWQAHSSVDVYIEG